MEEEFFQIIFVTRAKLNNKLRLYTLWPLLFLGVLESQRGGFGEGKRALTEGNLLGSSIDFLGFLKRCFGVF